MVDKEILREKDQIVGDLGKIVVGLIMIVVSILVLTGVKRFDDTLLSILLLFGGIGTIMWGIRK